MMDRLVGILVRLIVFFSRFAPTLARWGLVDYRSWTGRGTLHVLLVGYNGARNTGADVRVAEITKQLEAQLGKDNIEISIMTLDEESSSCYFGPQVNLVHFSSIFFLDLFRACCAAHMVMLCEGSTLKSTFANALTLFFCEAAGIMKVQGKPCIAYGSEAGEMDPFVERAVKKLCSDTYFIARTQNSLDCIRRLGLRGRLGTDTAWSFDSSSHARWAHEKLRESGWDGRSPLFGIAVINPFWWPVRPSLAKWARAAFTKDRSLQFQKWYFFSWSSERERQLDAYLDALAQAANAAAGRGYHVVLLGMERLDADACARLENRLDAQPSVFLASKHDGYEMASVLRILSLLVTSRYHAQVLSMGGAVPSVAVSMDERLQNIMEEIGADRQQLLRADDPQLAQKLADAVAFVEANHAELAERIERSLPAYLRKMDEMGIFLERWLRCDLQWSPTPCAAD